MRVFAPKAINKILDTRARTKKPAVKNLDKSPLVNTKTVAYQ